MQERHHSNNFVPTASIVFLLIALGFWVATAVSKSLPTSYDNFKVLRVQTPELNSLNVINNDLKDYVDIWAEPRLGFHSDIMVSSHDLLMIEQRLFAANLEYFIMIDNVCGRLFFP